MEIVRYAVLGLGIGALYALIAAGLVTVYRGSGIVNFAQGAFVMFAGYLDYELTTAAGLNFWPATILTVAATALLGALVQVVVLRPMRNSSPLTRVVATLGVLITLQSAAALHYGYQSISVASYLPTRSVDILPSVPIGLNDVIIFVIGLVVTVALWGVYRFSPFGRLTSAVAENQRATASLGRSPDTIAVTNWMIGAGLAGLAGVLIAPITFLDPSGLALLVVPAMAAALVGGFASFPLAFAGALLIGIGESLTTRYVSNPGWSDSAAFLLIIIVVLIRGRGLPLRSFVLDRLAAVGSGRVRVIPLLVSYVVLMVLLGFVLPVQWILPTAVTLVAMLFCLSVLVVAGYGGQLSLAQYVIGGLAALVTAQLAGGTAHWPFILAAPAGVAVAVATGGLMGIPALRTRGITLAIVTLGLGVVLFSLVLNNSSYNGGVAGISIDPPTLFGWSINPLVYQGRYAMVCVTALFLAGLAITNVRRGASGRKLLAVRSNERAATALGISVYGVKLYAFMLAAGVAGMAGVLLAFMQSAVLPAQFDQLTSINYVTVTVVGGIGLIGGSGLGALLIPNGLVAQIFAAWPTLNSWLPLIGGLSVIFVLRTNQDGLWAMNRDMIVTAYQRLARRRPGRRAAPVPAPASAPAIAASAEPALIAPEGTDALQAAAALQASADRPAVPRTVRVTPATLRVDGLSVTFGGVTAVADASLTIVPGEVAGLIGPNGAGKTTLIDAITGFVRPSGGDILLSDVSIHRWSARRRAVGGLARSFQSVELFAGLTVRENLAVACESAAGRLRFLSDLIRPGRVRLSPAALQAVDDFGLVGDLDRPAESLPFGRRRLVAIARAVAAQPSVLLLDEPAAGLDEVETAELSVLVRSLAHDWGIAVLLVEHNLDMVLQLCDRVTVMVTGSVLYSGTPADVRNHPDVLAAYIGSHADHLGDVPSAEALAEPAPAQQTAE
jgi:ABC-type branched-subunit amino acid transport system ATPase component/branched-subunit amino acid ABC-type transport system permease component